MGALSALIVGPCVAAPLAGALLYIAQTGDAVLGGGRCSSWRWAWACRCCSSAPSRARCCPSPGRGWKASRSSSA
jgi:hypothetical protein